MKITSVYDMVQGDRDMNNEFKIYMIYFRKEKIESAKEMLKDSEYTVYEIAMILGFSSESHFIRAFKEQMSETPGEYRRR